MFIGENICTTLIGLIPGGNAYKALPDTLVWRDLNPFNEPLIKYYFRHPMFNSYPAVESVMNKRLNFANGEHMWPTRVKSLFPSE